MSAETQPPMPGQRWVSDSEPELGLGTLVSADARSLVLRFEAVGEERRYAAGSAPLHRVSLAPGDELTDLEGERLRIDEVEHRAGLAFYLCGERVVTEAELSPRMAIGGPRERLLAGRCDPASLFELRREARERLEQARHSPVRGFVGPRLELLPHQFYIASEVTSRHRPRVLLADETGLGKTIEACLILHRLLLTGRARRALILVPDALIHQWLVELRRRFQLRPAIFDEERCLAMEESEPGSNPFEDEQLVLAGWNLLVGDELRVEQAATAGWDVVIVDEAHHLSGLHGEHGAAYQAVARVSAGADGLLLLTATPTQLGEEGHFERLRLLDPERHSDFEAWKRESERHQEAARLGAELAAPAPLRPETAAGLASLLGMDADDLARRAAEPAARAELLARLLDRHGPGRVIFRNTRSVLTDLPERQVRLRPLAAVDPLRSRRELSHDDPRIADLAALLLASPDEKLLVICREAATARLVKESLERLLSVDLALFHEELSLVQRDRNAAWFVEPGGARMLICSEIGSEGRNFQHARHLVMFDLPLDPDLVEQRIGRIDRIGQHGHVLIDVPFVQGTGQEVLARWHHEGIDAFARPVATAQALLELFGDRVSSLATRWDETGSDPELEGELERLLEDTTRAARELEAKVESGRDRLLELSSLRRDVADRLLEEIHAADDDPSIDDFFLRLLDHFHVVAEEVSHRTFRFIQQGRSAVTFASLARGDLSLTFDRETALLREDYELASMDHPLLLDAMELLLDSEAGSAGFALRRRPGPLLLLLEAIFVLEVVAPPELHSDRFLPPTCVRAIVDQTRADRSEDAREVPGLVDGDRHWLREKLPVLRPLLESLLERAGDLAMARATEARAAATRTMEARLGAELDRLRELARANDRVRPEEIALLEAERDALSRYLAGARLRLDGLRLIWCGPEGPDSPPARRVPR